MLDKKKSIIAMIISTFGFALMSVFLKLTGDIPVVQKVVIRTYIILITLTIMMRHYGVKFVGVRHYRLLILRAIFGTLGIILNYYAIDHLILSDANILFRLSTFFLLIFSWIFLGEKFSLNQVIAIVIAFIGVLFIIKPQLNIDIIPYLIALVGATFAAGAYTVVRALGNKEEPMVVVFFFASFTSIVLTPIAIMGFQPMDGKQIVFSILAGLSAAIAQVGVTYAYKHAPASEVSIYNYFGVIFSTFFSIFIFGVVPDLYSFIGYAIVLGTAYYMWKLTVSK